MPGRHVEPRNPEPQPQAQAHCQHEASYQMSRFRIDSPDLLIVGQGFLIVVKKSAVQHSPEVRLVA
jgi:hypothetical protein